MIEPATTHVKLMLPARAQYLKVLRSTIASIAVGLDFSVERIDDLKMAVVEACSQLLSAGDSGKLLTIEADRTPDGLQVTATLAGVQTWPPADIESTLTWMVLSTVASDVSFGNSEEGAYVRLFVDRTATEVARGTEPTP